MNFTQLTVTDVLLMMMSAILVENFIFSKFYGCCPFLGVSTVPIRRSAWAWLSHS